MTEEAPISLESALKGMEAGKTLAEQRGLTLQQLVQLGTVIEHIAKEGNHETALSGCRFLVTHDHNNIDWWLLQGKVARRAQDFQLSIFSFIIGFVSNGDPEFCAEMARTYLATNELALALQAVETGEQIIAAEGSHEKTAQSLASLKQEITKRKNN